MRKIELSPEQYADYLRTKHLMTLDEMFVVVMSEDMAPRRSYAVGDVLETRGEVKGAPHNTLFNAVDPEDASRRLQVQIHRGSGKFMVSGERRRFTVPELLPVTVEWMAS